MDKNHARQVLVPEVTGTLDATTKELVVASPFGNHRIVRSKASIVLPGERALFVPATTDLEATSNLKNAKKVRWLGDLSPADPAIVLESLRGAFHFKADDPTAGITGLRDPQIGAVHSVLGFWSTRSSQPATVVMPT